MNGEDLLRNGLTSSRCKFSDLPKIHLGRCMNCGAVKVVKDNNYICQYCGTVMEDVDKLFKQRMSAEDNLKFYKNKK